jgi:L-fucose mutarotase/ribose pyranase (RbsD/FucU family)
VLKGIHPLITPELLGVLVEMGHGDDLAVVDANFPATSVAMETAHGRVVHLASASVPEAVAAVLSPFPLDSFVEHPAVLMGAEGHPGEAPPVQQEIQAEVDWRRAPYALGCAREARVLCCRETHLRRSPNRRAALVGKRDLEEGRVRSRPRCLGDGRDRLRPGR